MNCKNCDKCKFTKIEKLWLDMTDEQRAEYIPANNVVNICEKVSRFNVGFTHFKASIENENNN